MKIIVTGGSGFIGSHLLEKLIEDGHKVYSIDRQAPTHGIAGFQDIRADFCDDRKIKDVFNKIKPEVVVHLGAVPSVQTSVKEPAESMHSNVAGTYTVLEAARCSGARRVVFASSAAVYGYTGEDCAGKALSEDLPLRPKNPYGLAKKLGEEMMEMWARNDFWKGVDTVSLRFFNVFGQRQRRDASYATCIERFLYQWQNHEPLTIVPPGAQRRDMVFVKDVVQAISSAIFTNKQFVGVAINLGSGRNYTIFEMAEVIGGKNYPTVFIDPRPGDVQEVLADISRARELLDWEPETSFADGVAIIKEHIKTHEEKHHAYRPK